MDKIKFIKRRWKHSITWGDWINLLIAEGLILCVWAVCYRSLLWLLLLQPAIYPIHCYQEKQKKKKKIWKLKQAFQSLLQSLMTSLQAGYSLENGFLVAVSEMKSLYPEPKHPIHAYLQGLVSGIELQIPIWKVLYRMAKDTEVEEIYQFAVVLEVISDTGGNTVEVIRNTMEQMQIKTEAEEEIQVLMSGKIFEKNIMLLMPFFILLYLGCMNPSYIRIFYETIVGHLIMTMMLSVIIVCFYWTEKILNHCMA